MQYDGSPKMWTALDQAELVTVLVPKSLDDVRGDANRVQGFLMSSVNEVTIGKNRFVVRAIFLHEQDEAWCEAVDALLCEFDQAAGAFRALRIATLEERDELRVPCFIQDDERPSCCGRRMFYVGRLDDNRLCAEPPPEYELWWHDIASFYVYTCSICMECKVVGQQF